MSTRPWIVGDQPLLFIGPSFITLLDELQDAQQREAALSQELRDAHRATSQARAAMLEALPDEVDNSVPHLSLPNIIWWRKNERQKEGVFDD